MKIVKFAAEVKKIDSIGGWHYVLLPASVKEELCALSGKKGNIPVLVTIGKTTWPSTIMSMGNQQWFVAVKADVRKVEALHAGSQVVMFVAPDTARLTR